MASGTPNFADHLRTRCEEIGLQVLAEALDRLEAPWEGEVNEQAPCMAASSSSVGTYSPPRKAAA
jgi:hypothetical protein